MRNPTLIIVLLAMSVFTVCAQEEQDMYNMSLEDLMQIEVTSVSKQSENLQNIPSNIYVITSKDIIERSSAQNLMQLLREHVPGYWATANDYRNADAVTRNFYESSVLVQLDGTPILDIIKFDLDYESFDIPFEQIDRIEVIKGSGGTVYGANSASGVISIYTKNPNDQKKFFADVHYATPGQLSTSLIATPLRKKDLSTSVYAKYTTFEGFEQLKETEQPTSTVPRTYSDGTTTINNRFTGDDQTFNTLNLGYSFEYSPNSSLKLSSRLNYVRTENNRYYQYFNPANGTFVLDANGNPQPRAEDDEIFLVDNGKTRLTANVRADYSFAENHSIFGRVSTNAETKPYGFGLAGETNNVIYDFEVQDNITLGFNNLSVGFNYRLVNYDIDFPQQSNIFEIVDDPKETISGFFVQDKLTFMNDRLNIYLGGKMENFSLVNEDYYFSTNAKLSYAVSDKLSLWGGFTQSFTTPSYEQTSAAIDIFSAPVENFIKVFDPLLTANSVPSDALPSNVYEQAITNGASHSDAIDEVINTLNSLGLPSDTESALVGAMNNFARPFEDEFKIQVRNNENTEPARFQTYELGVRLNPSDRIQLSSSYFYSDVQNAIGSSTNRIEELDVISSPVNGESVFATFFGNFLEGYNQGLESRVKAQITNGLLVELSHAWFDYEVNYQSDAPFDISNIGIDVRDSTWRPLVPENVFRLKAYYDWNSWKFSSSLTYATEFNFKTADVESRWQFENQRFTPLYASVEYRRNQINSEQIGGSLPERLIVNLRIDKSFAREKLNAYIYAYDLTNLDPFTEGINQLEIMYPRQVAGMIGLGLQYKLN